MGVALPQQLLVGITHRPFQLVSHCDIYLVVLDDLVDANTNLVKVAPNRLISMRFASHGQPLGALLPTLLDL